MPKYSSPVFVYVLAGVPIPCPVYLGMIIHLQLVQLAIYLDLVDFNRSAADDRSLGSCPPLVRSLGSLGTGFPNQYFSQDMCQLCKATLTLTVSMALIHPVDSVAWGPRTGVEAAWADARTPWFAGATPTDASVCFWTSCKQITGFYQVVRILCQFIATSTLTLPLQSWLQ